MSRDDRDSSWQHGAMQGSGVETGRLATGPGVEIAWERRGAGPRTLLVPSASWLAADLDGLLPGATLVFHDLRGRGRSSAILDETLLGLSQDLADVEALRGYLGLESMSILGWSYHGLLAARYALEHPGRVERLVLVGPSGPRLSPWFGQFLNNLARSLDLESLREIDALRRTGARDKDPAGWCRAVHGAFFHSYVADASVLARMRSDPCVEPNLDAERVNDQGRKVIEKLGDYDWIAEFSGLETPTLILHGEKDPVPIGGSEDWVRALPRAELVRLAGVGHMPWLEAPERFFPVIRRFLELEP